MNGRLVKEKGIEIYEYGLHVCLDYYYLKDDDSFYHIVGDSCTKLKYCTNSARKQRYVIAKDYHTGADVQIYYNVFKKDNAWIWLE